MPLDTSHLIKLHITQKWSLNQIAKHYGVKWDTIKARLDKSRCKVWNASCQNRTQVNVGKIIQLFQDGVSVKAIAEQLHVDRNVIYKRMADVGLQPRTGSEANLIRFQNSTKEERQRITAAAHAAVCGSRRTEEDLCKRAQGVMRQACSNKWECAVQMGLTDVGLPTIPQYAIGKYNVDLLIAETPFAVEVFGGSWHAYGSHVTRFRSRYEFIRDTGYSVFIIWCLTPTIEPQIYHKIKSIVDRFCTGETVFREQYVCRSDGNMTAPYGDKLNYLTSVMRLKHC